MVKVEETTQGVLDKISEGFAQKGAFNLRQNGISICHGDSEHIKIKKKEDKPGIDIFIDGETKGEKVFIPVVVSVSGMTDLVYNDFYVADGADVDIVENIARERACRLFGAEHANVQPHSGAQANLAVYFALLQPGDTVLGMNLAEGGHLTHGSPVNMSGAYYNFAAYGVDPVTHRIDYDKLMEQACELKPKLIVAGASAYPRAIDF